MTQSREGEAIVKIHVPELRVKYLFEQGRFLETLYFGSQQIHDHPSPELYLYVGLSCCAAVRPIAATERILRAPTEELSARRSEPLADFAITRDTRMVYVGLQYLLRAAEAGIKLEMSPSLESAIEQILLDLTDYALQDFKAFPCADLPISLRESAWAAVALISGMVGERRNDHPRYEYLLSCGKTTLSRLLDGLHEH